MKRIANYSWWECDAGSLLFFCKWPQLYQAWTREGQYHYLIYNFPQFLCPHDPANIEEDLTKMKNKVCKFIKRLYIDSGTVISLTHMFLSAKG